jgi:SAM-dependent methyltransferase
MKLLKGLGQYDLEYRNCPCFWGTAPSKFVRKIPEIISAGCVLDLGAGEGKNAIYLADLGYQVKVVEISLYAVRNFVNRLISENVERNISIILDDVLSVAFSSQFDIIIAYGLFHCLPSKEQVAVLVANMKRWSAPGGIHVVSTFTNEIGIPDVQSYLEPTLLDPFELRNVFYQDWEIIDYETGNIQEKHPTSLEEHEHSLCRLIARRPQ